MCQSTEVVDLGDSRRGIDEVEPGFAERTDVEPAAVCVGLSASLSDRVVEAEKEEPPGIVTRGNQEAEASLAMIVRPGIATPGGPRSRSPIGDDAFMLPPAPAAVNAKDPTAG